MSVAGANNIQTMNGWFKERYAKAPEQLIPEFLKLYKKIAFVTKERQVGNLYHTPCILGHEHGVTFADTDDDAFSLNPAVAGQIKDAIIKGNPLVMRSILGIATASRAAQGGEQSFGDAIKFLVANMLRSMSKKLEIELLYGQMGYGVVSSISTVAGKSVVVIDSKEWAAGIWAGAEKMPIEFYDVSTSTKHGVEYVIHSVDFDAKSITLTTVADVAVVAGDVIFHSGAFGKEFIGIHKMLSMTSGSLFGIDVAQYNLFRGNKFDADASALSFSKLNKAAAKAVEKGLDGKLYVLVNPKTWANLMNDQAALRKYDASYSSAEMKNGSSSIKFFSQNGELEIEPSIYVKEGYAYGLAIDNFMRVGSTDLTFKRPGQGDQFFKDLESAAGYELRLFTDQALFCSAPGKNVLIHNIVND